MVFGQEKSGLKPLKKMARPEGFGPPTAWFVARYSIQLSYGRVVLKGRIIHTAPWSVKRYFRVL